MLPIVQRKYYSENVRNTTRTIKPPGLGFPRGAYLQNIRIFTRILWNYGLEFFGFVIAH
jgi:hypothetical protein